MHDFVHSSCEYLVAYMTLTWVYFRTTPRSCGVAIIDVLSGVFCQIVHGRRDVGLVSKPFHACRPDDTRRDATLRMSRHGHGGVPAVNGPIPVTAVDQEWNKSNSKYSKYHRSADCIPAAGSLLHPSDLILTAVLWRREDEK